MRVRGPFRRTLSELRIANQHDAMLAQTQANADGSLVFNPEKIEVVNIEGESRSEVTVFSKRG